MIEHDKLGYCAFCHVSVSDIVEVRGARVLKWRPTRRESLFMLSNNSILHVTLCEECDSRIDNKNYLALMDSIVKGWEEELKISQMSDDEKEKYRDQFYSLEIKEKI